MIKFESKFEVLSWLEKFFSFFSQYILIKLNNKYGFSSQFTFLFTTQIMQINKFNLQKNNSIPIQSQNRHIYHLIISSNPTITCIKNRIRLKRSTCTYVRAFKFPKPEFKNSAFFPSQHDHIKWYYNICVCMCVWRGKLWVVTYVIF